MATQTSHRHSVGRFERVLNFLPRSGFGQVHAHAQRNANNTAVCGEPRDLAPAGSPTPEMVAGSLDQATAKLYYIIR